MKRLMLFYAYANKNNNAVNRITVYILQLTAKLLTSKVKPLILCSMKFTDQGGYIVVDKVEWGIMHLRKRDNVLFFSSTNSSMNYSIDDWAYIKDLIPPKDLTILMLKFGPRSEYIDLYA